MKIQQPKKLAKELISSNDALSKYSVLKVLTMIEKLPKGKKLTVEKLKSIDRIGDYKANCIYESLKYSQYFPNNKLE